MPMLQTATSLSMAEETEFVAVSEVAKKFIYLQCLCAKLDVPIRWPTHVGEDNFACVQVE